MISLLMILAGLLVGGGTIVGILSIIPQLPVLLATLGSVLAGWGALSIIQALPEILKTLIGG